MTTSSSSKCDTLVTLRDHIEARFAAQDKAVETARALMEARMAASDKFLEGRLEILNHLRQNVITKQEFEAALAIAVADARLEIAKIQTELSALREWRAEHKGRATSGSIYLSYGFAAIAMIVSVFAIILEIGV